jgi:hypothetical protein
LEIDDLDRVAAEEMKSDKMIRKVIEQLPSSFKDKSLIQACRYKTMNYILTIETIEFSQRQGSLSSANRSILESRRK